MDWISAVTGIGTLVVAIVALYTFWTTGWQLRILEKQALFQRSDVYPLVEVESKSVAGNSVNLKLRNRGRGAAFEVAVHCSYYPMRVQGGKQDFGNEFHIANPEETRPFRTVECALLLKNSSTGSRLYATEEGSFVGEVRFLGESKRSKMESVSKFLLYDELRVALAREGFDAVGISLSVACKDITENYVDEHPLYAVIAILRKHVSLEEIVRENLRFAAIPLYPEELEQMEWELYAHGKTQRGLLEDRIRKP